jgi:aconitate hydratase
MKYPKFTEPEKIQVNTSMLVPPEIDTEKIELEKGPNIAPLPSFEAIKDTLEVPVLLKVGDDISTDEIMPAGSRVLPFRSNIPEISKFVFEAIDPTYYERALAYQSQGSIIVGGKNYGQGSSREHAALAPRYLGVKAVLAKSFARIHFQNLTAFGILPLIFKDFQDWDRISQDDVLIVKKVREAIKTGDKVMVINQTKDESYESTNSLTPQQVKMILEGSLINTMRKAEMSHS